MRPVTFLVDQIADDGTVYGSNDYVNVPLGTVYTEIILQRVVGKPPRSFTADLGVIEAVNLRLVNVENKFFRSPLEVIPAGHHGALTLVGSGMPALRNALKNKKPREYVLLRAALLGEDLGRGTAWTSEFS